MPEVTLVQIRFPEDERDALDSYRRQQPNLRPEPRQRANLSGARWASALAVSDRRRAYERFRSSDA
jgi:hypothetical protein